ncbi:MAG: FAD-dependent oxidoreductase [Brevinematales bacterium]|nr:FAD-dependent oxidoreductase [Brevinematales bacterium]
MKPRQVSVAVIGGGIAGIEAAKKLAELHQSPLLVIPNQESLGGKTLRQGMLALRFLMEHRRSLSQEMTGTLLYQNLKRRLAEYQELWRKEVTKDLVRLGVEIVYGRARFKSPLEFSVGDVSYTAERVILATGSQWEECEENEKMWTVWDEIPASVVIFGGGKEACEVAYLFGSLGSEVTLVTMAGVVLEKEGERFRRIGERLLKQVGVKILSAHTLSEVKKETTGWKVQLSDTWGQQITLGAQRLCFMQKRKPSLPFEVEKDPLTGKIRVNERYQTKTQAVFACGDVIHAGCQAHVAKREGILVAENVFLDSVPPLVSSVSLHKDRIDYHIVPEVAFLGYPLVRVGMTEEEARMKFQPYELHVVEREWALYGERETPDFLRVSILLHKAKQHILGAVAYGPSAESLVNLMAFAMTKEVRFHEMGEIVYLAGSLEDRVGSLALEI